MSVKIRKTAAPENVESRKVIIYGGGPLIYFYLIPLLLIGISMAYVVLQYKADVTQIQNEINRLIGEIKIVEIEKK